MLVDHVPVSVMIYAMMEKHKESRETYKALMENCMESMEKRKKLMEKVVVFLALPKQEIDTNFLQSLLNR
jgi:hypothetical protein